MFDVTKLLTLYELSNGIVTNDITWSWKVKLVTQYAYEANISKTAGDATIANYYIGL